MSLIVGAHKRTLQANGLAFTAWEMGEGPLVLCLHGFPDTPETWRHLLPTLAQAGFRAVAVTSRGYEPSSQPADGDYSLAALASDAVGWIDALGADRAHLVGHDWGSSILHMAAAAAPERVASLTALAVPHPGGFAALVAEDFEQLARSWYVFLFQTAGLAEALIARQDGAFLDWLWRTWSPGWNPPADQLAERRDVFCRPGVPEAALAYYRSSFNPAHPRLADVQRLLASPIRAPTLGLTGARDGCVSPAIFSQAAALAPFHTPPVTEVVPAVGHFLHLEAPRHVNDRIVSWLNSAA